MNGYGTFPRLAAILLALAWLAPVPGSAAAVEWDAESRRAGGVKGPVQLPDGTVIAVDSRWTSEGAVLECRADPGEDTTWTLLATITHDTRRGVDLGDAAIMRRRNGDLLCSYRRNLRWRRPPEEQSFSLEVAVSSDGGRTWNLHSVVASAQGKPPGLWSTFIHETAAGELQCYYDDEVTPWEQGWRRHQWLTMKRWDEAARQWTNPVTVSRAHDPEHLSRDGMCSVVELPGGRLLCVFETVRVERPHKSVIRHVTSDDGGATWSWRERERGLVYAPNDPDYNALAPWAIRLSDGRILCVFVTDEDREVPDTPSTGRLDEDVKFVVSEDGGATWSRPAELISDEHPCYMPGVIELSAGRDRGSLLVQYASRRRRQMKLGRPLPRTTMADQPTTASSPVCGTYCVGLH